MSRSTCLRMADWRSSSSSISKATKQRLIQDIVTHMRQSEVTDIQGATGLMNLRSDLNEIVRLRTKGKALELIVRGMIVE